MVDHAVYAKTAQRRADLSLKLAPIAWAGLAVNLVALALITHSLVVNIGATGLWVESFIATTVSVFAFFIGVAMTLGWVRWLRTNGSPNGLSVLSVTTLILIVVALSPLLKPEFYLF